MPLLDRRRLVRGYGNNPPEDNVTVPPVDVTVPPPPIPVDPPDPVDPPVVRANHGQQVSFAVHARNAARQEAHGKVTTATSSDITKLTIDKIEQNQIFVTLLDESAIVSVTGTIDEVAYPTIIVTGPSTGLLPYAKMIGSFSADNLTNNGSKILTMQDSSGKGNHLVQATDASRLALSAVVAVDGKTVMQFDGSAFYSLDPINSGTIPPITDIAQIVICKATNVIQKVAMQVGSDGTAKGNGLSPDTNAGNFGSLLNGQTWEDTEVAADSSNKHLYIVNRSGTVTRYYRDGRPLFPIGGTAPGTPYTKVSVPGFDHRMAGDWRLGFLANALTEQEIINTAKYFASVEGTTDSSVDPSTVYTADDDFSIGATIDLTGARRTGSTSWTAFNAGGSLTNSQSGGDLILTLPQSASDLFRGFSQPDPNIDDTTYTYWKIKLIPTQVAANGNRAGICCISTGNSRLLAIMLRMIGGIRSIGMEGYFSLGGSDGDKVTPITGFSAADFSKEWTIHVAWNRSNINVWFQIDNGAPQLLTANNSFGGFFNFGLRPDKIALTLSSQNAAGGDTIAHFTDFKRGI